MTSFYRGTRQCLGQEYARLFKAMYVMSNTDRASLAWCELYVTFANLFRRFEVAIHDTSDKDMEWVDAVLIV